MSTQSRAMATSSLPAAMSVRKEQEEDGEPFEDKMRSVLSRKLRERIVGK